MEWLVGNNVNSNTANRCLSYIKFWLNSIAMHTYSVTNDRIAPIILIGTHKDKVSDVSEHTRISLLLYNTFKLHIAWRSVWENDNGIGINGTTNLCFFPIDNVMGQHDGSVRSLLRTINNIISESEYVQKEVPLAWLQTVDQFSVVIRDRSWLSYDDAAAIALSFGVEHDDIVEMLEFLNEMGFLLWNQEELLRDIIILDPISFFVKPVTNVICKHNPTEGDPTRHFTKLHRKCFNFVPYDWNEMIEKGVVSKNNLLNLLLLSDDGSFSTSNVIQLMIKYGLIVPFAYSMNNSHDVTEYLVPSILPTMPVNISRQKEEEWDHVGYYVFTTDPKLSKQDFISISELQSKGFLPKGLFERLVCKAVAWSKYSSSSSHSQIYQDYMTSYFGSQPFRMRNFPDKNYIEISTKGSNPLSVMNRAYDLIVNITTEFMKRLYCYKAVTTTLEEKRRVGYSIQQE
eukprot:gene12321-16525_t